jgi:cell fate regulator YaaT (PSP1 superfamily)
MNEHTEPIMETMRSIKLRKQRRIFDCDAGELRLNIGDKIIVETESGQQLGVVVARPAHRCCAASSSPAANKVLRKAEQIDIRQEELNILKEREYAQVCRKKIVEYNLPMKLINVEIVPDGSKIIFFFTAENRVDFRSLVKELAADLRTRIEMRQIGARNEAQILGGIGCCGRELCCTSFLHQFCPVTIKMTKEQGLALDPAKISGVCGRLMCCLSYEYETYAELKKNLPKIGKRITTSQGTGKIRQVNVITQKILIEMEDGHIIEMNADEFKPEMLAPAQPSK